MSFFQRIKALREKRAGLIAQAGQILEAAGDSDLTTEQETSWRALHADADKMKGQLEVLERQADAEAELREGAGRKTQTELNRKVLSEDPEERKEQETRAYEQWLRVGKTGLTEEERAILSGLRFQADEQEEQEVRRELRAQSVGTAAKGGYTVPEGPMQPLEVALKAFGGMLEAARVITTDHGRDIPWPTSDDTSNEGELISENAEVAESEIAYNEKVLKAYKFSSKLIRIPTELFEDTGIDIVAHVNGALGERLGRTLNRYTTLGTGTNEPHGAVTAATLGKTAAAAAALAYGDLFGLTHSVDPAYRTGPKVRHMFNDNTLSKWKQVKDDANHLVFQRDLAGGTPPTLDGFPYTINQIMASVATTNKVQLFGDFNKFVIRRVRGIRVLRLEERFAERDQVGFVAFSRFDSRLIDAGTNPLKYLQMA